MLLFSKTYFSNKITLPEVFHYADMHTSYRWAWLVSQEKEWKVVMAEGFLRNHPGLRPFVLSDVQLTGTNIGGGAYGCRPNHPHCLAISVIVWFV